MAETFRTIISRISQAVSVYRNPVRKKINLPVRISVCPKIRTTSKKSIQISGETADINAQGISFVVNFIRVGEHYLVNDGTVLEIEISLPNGKVNLQAVGCRYEQIEIDSSVSKFLVGARITEIDKTNKEMLEEYLRSGSRRGDAKVNGTQLGLELPRN